MHGNESVYSFARCRDWLKVRTSASVSMNLFFVCHVCGAFGQEKALVRWWRSEDLLASNYTFKQKSSNNN
jgi:hypothetical protein